MLYKYAFCQYGGKLELEEELIQGGSLRLNALTTGSDRSDSQTSCKYVNGVSAFRKDHQRAEIQVDLYPDRECSFCRLPNRSSISY